MSTNGLKHIGQLTPDPNNARQHNPRNIGMIVDSLQKVGGARSIVIDEDNVILAGNGVIEAAAEAGIESVRVIEASGNEIIAVRRRGLSEEQKTLLKYYDNRTAELADWNAAQIVADLETDVDLSGLWSDDEIAELVASVIEEPPEDPGPQMDRAEELCEKWSVERGQIWEIGKHRLMCGDSTGADDVAILMADEKASLVFTDPPYRITNLASFGASAETGKKRQYGELVKAPLYESWLGVIGDFVDSSSNILVFESWRNTPDLWEALETSGYTMRNMIIWHVPDRRQFWHQTWFYNRYDVLLFGARGPNYVFNFDGHVTDVIEHAKVRTTIENEGFAGGGKPVEIIMPYMRALSNLKALILDPFLGSGTTMVAAERLGRLCYGMEIWPAYVAVTLQRLADMGLEPKLVETL